MMHISYSEKCTGCSACVCICPHNCINLTRNLEGFMYPSVEEKNCVNCGLCVAVCPIENHNLQESKKAVAYISSNEVREQSTSGGFFTVLSDYILDNNGVIYGAVYDTDFMVCHIRGDNSTDRNMMRTSKYVQSDIGDVYIKVQEDLNNNVMVLFSGTPCQIAGLYNYLNQKRVPKNKLVTCDLVCHGVPSPLIWKEYLHFLKKKYDDEVVSVNFRDKELGWHKPQLKIEFREHTQKLTEAKDPFYNLFYSNCILRHSCHTCEYAKKDRIADFTMADCWGIENNLSQYDDNRGCSLILLNNERAVDIFFQVVKNRKDIFFDIDVDSLRQPHLKRAAAKSSKRELFWKEYENKGFFFVMNKYGYYSWYMRIIKKLKRIIIKVIRK